MAVLIHSSSHTQFLQSNTPPLGVRVGVLSPRTWTDFCKCLNLQRVSLVTQRLERLPPMWETRVRSLGWEDPLEKEMVTHSSIFLWRIPWMEEPGGLQSMGSQTVDTTEQLHFHFHFQPTEYSGTGSGFRGWNREGIIISTFLLDHSQWGSELPCTEDTEGIWWRGTEAPNPQPALNCQACE